MGPNTPPAALCAGERGFLARHGASCCFDERHVRLIAWCAMTLTACGRWAAACRDGATVYTEVHAPSDEVLQAVLHKFITRTMRLLTRRGVLIEEDVPTYPADNNSDSDEART